MRAMAAFLTVLTLAGACARHGREVFVREGCVACHRFRGTGAGQVVDLSDVATRQDAAALRRQITNPAAGNPASRMPAFDRLDWYDLQSLIAFLRS